MLGDAAGFARRHLGRADGVEQRGLAVVDVTHDGHDRRTRHQRGGIVGGVEQAFLDVGFGDALDGVAQFLGQELGGIGVDHVVDLRHVALLHQELDDVHTALGHAVGELLDGDGLRNRDFAHELFLRLVGRMALQPLHAAAEGCDGTLAHFVGIERGHQREPSAASSARRCAPASARARDAQGRGRRGHVACAGPPPRRARVRDAQ